jgi:hypothetical protein
MGATANIMRAVRWINARPGAFALFVLAITAAGLGLDRVASLGAQMVLAACTWVILLTSCAYLAPEQRAQTAVVVAVATCAEVIGSLVWGVYAYRLGNLPMFVPPGHGLVYLAGLRISQTRTVQRRPRAFLGVVLALLAGWAAAGLTLLPRTDAAGAFGAAVLAAFILRGRAPTVYGGVFLFVAFLELYGTAVGTWRWEATIPGLGVPDGNPPAGAAAGYVFFDICALALAPGLLAAVRWARPRLLAPARGSIDPHRFPGRGVPSEGWSAASSWPSSSWPRSRPRRSRTPARAAPPTTASGWMAPDLPSPALSSGYGGVTTGSS